MSIALITTGGFGNGTLTTTIGNVTARGFLGAATPSVPAAGGRHVKAVDDRPYAALVDARPYSSLVDARPFVSLVDARPLIRLQDHRPFIRVNQ